MAMSWLDRLLFGIRLVLDPDGVELPDRPALQFAGDGVESVEDDDVNKRTVVTIGAGAGAVPNTRKITVSSPLTITPSDGVLDEDLALSFSALTTNTQHGNRGGGSLHDAATSSVAGFMSAADKTKLDAYPPVADMATVVYVNDQIAAISGGGGVEGVTAAAGSPVTVDNTDPLNPIVDWSPTDDVDMAGYYLTTCAGLSNTSTVEIDSGTTTNLGTSTATAVNIGHGTITTAITGLTDSIRAGLASTKTIGRSLRNATAATSLATVQISPSDALEGSAWVSGALKTMHVRWTLVPRTNGNLDWICEYDTGSGTYAEAFRYTTSSSGQFAAVLQSYALACGSGGAFDDSSGSGMFFGGSGALQMKSYDSSNPFLFHSDQGFTYELAAAKIERKNWGTVGVNYEDRVKKVVTTTDATTTNTITLSMADNSAVMWEVKAYCYVTTDPSKRAYFHWHGYFNRNGGAPTSDEVQASLTDKVVGAWGTPPQLTITAGAPTTNDVSVQVTGVLATSIKWTITAQYLVSTTSA